MLSDEGSRVPLAKTMPFSMSQPCTVTNLSSVRLSFQPTWEPEMMKAVLAGPDAEAEVALGEFSVGRGEVSPVELGTPGLQLLEAAVSGNGRGEELRCEFHADVYFPCRFLHGLMRLFLSESSTFKLMNRPGFVKGKRGRHNLLAHFSACDYADITLTPSVRG